MNKWLALLTILFASVFSMKADDDIDAVDSLSVLYYNNVTRIGENSYSWFERTFNNYDTAYVAPIGTDFHVRLSSKNWIDFYRLNFTEGGHMNLRSDIVSDLGIHINYKILSVGYSENLNKINNGYERKRKSFNLAVTTSLLYLDFHIQKNQLSSKMTHFQTPAIDYQDVIRFDGVKVGRWGIDAYYFFNHKQYSQSAAFNYGRIQKRSRGSFFLGLSYSHLKYTFDFSLFPSVITGNLPDELIDYTYHADVNDYFIKGGYAFSWAISRKWMIAFAESPLIGYRTGKINPLQKNNISFSNQLRISAICNINRFFIGLQGELLTNFMNDNQIKLVGNVLTAELSVGFHFNLFR